MGDQVVGRGVESRVGYRFERIEDEQGGGRVPAELGAVCLAPVPAPAGHTGVVTPHHLAGVGVLDHRDAFGNGVEGLLAGGADQPRRTDVAGKIFPTERDLM